MTPRVNISIKQIFSVIMILTITIYLLLPILFPNLRDNKIFVHNKISLGLDLKGGVSILLKVDINQYYKDCIGNTADLISNYLKNENINFFSNYSDNTKVIVNNEDKNNIENNNHEKIYDILKRKLNHDEYEVSLSNNQVIVEFTNKFKENTIKHLVNQSIEIIRHRIDDSGTREIDIQRQGDDMILIQIPGVYSTDEIKNLIGKTAKMTFHLISNDITLKNYDKLPFGIRMLPVIDLLSEDDESSEEDIDSENNKNNKTHNKRNDIRLAQRLPVIIHPLMHGENLIDAQSIVGHMGEYNVKFRLNEEGTKTFANITNIYKNRNLAIVLDGIIISAPRITDTIITGVGVISGNLTAEMAKELALLLRSGALPTELKIIEERNIGPTLGQESIDAGCKAVIIGLIAVAIIMTLRYKYFGLLANIALIINLGMIIAIMSLFEATLTLPGISGIALTLGMAVDANVLIFERIREKSKFSQSIEEGYKDSFATIVDSNITTIGAAIVLYAFGTASIRGFAVTLIIGIISSMFTAVTLTKVILALFFRFYDKFYYKLHKNVKNIKYKKYKA
ncbi:protein translocase subunit SecD [Lyticum sinuosum]|uniref:Protein translocase subunit SecD n=1 Tax=Lyticum sinuosum TaxID=1332059 RepID=A0AAE4VJU4_9RICK|nr:protein translocase subunit SecD [Lyticum sinuosum]MDZ5761241.1 Protein translocase subunit SecD [Lyticum sinuosum]